MKNTFSGTANLTRATGGCVCLAAATLVIFVGWLATPESHSQAPASAATNPALSALLVKLKTQQDLMVANQTKIEAQTALLKENLRQAKIYAARGGSRPPLRNKAIRFIYHHEILHSPGSRGRRRAHAAFARRPAAARSWHPRHPAIPPRNCSRCRTANDDLLKRQDATLKDLTEMTDTANEIRIYSRRG